MLYIGELIMDPMTMFAVAIPAYSNQICDLDCCDVDGCDCGGADDPNG